MLCPFLTLSPRKAAFAAFASVTNPRKAAFAASPSIPHLSTAIFVSLDSVDSSMPEVNSASRCCDIGCKILINLPKSRNQCHIP